jgi:hypothetical protein
MNGLGSKEDLNILPLGSYDCLIGMHWLDEHHVVLYYHNKEFNFLNEEGKPRTIQQNSEGSYCLRDLNNAVEEFL